VEILFFLIGLLIGIISGLIPGLHSNTAIAILSSFGIGEEQMAVLIVALFSSHLVVSYIPSIFFGIPSDSSIVSVLPGQRMVKEGKGVLALNTVLLSILVTTLVCVAIFMFAMNAFSIVYAAIKPFVGHILLLFSIVFVLVSKNRFLTLCVFLLAGILGTASLNLKMYDVFLPLFSGFFAVSQILIYEKSAKIPKQKDEKPEFEIVKYSLLGIFLGFFADLLPGIGAPSQIAMFATILIPLTTVKYLATISAIATSEAVFSLATSASIGKSRIGATEWLSNYISISENLAMLLALFILSIAITSALVYLARKKIGKIADIDFSLLNPLILAYLAGITFILNGVMGLVILILASALGYATIKLGVNRTTLMGAIIVPTLLLLFRVFV